jgi:hypothetical protein
MNTQLPEVDRWTIQSKRFPDHGAAPKRTHNGSGVQGEEPPGSSAAYMARFFALPASLPKETPGALPG